MNESREWLKETLLQMRWKLVSKIDKLKQLYTKESQDEILKMIILEKFDHSRHPQINWDKHKLFQMSDEEYECAQTMILSLSSLESNKSETNDVKQLQNVWLNTIQREKVH